MSSVFKQSRRAGIMRLRTRESGILLLIPKQGDCEMIDHAYLGDGYEVVSVPITSSLASELNARARELGLDVTELILDLFIGALRSEWVRECPTFTVSDDFAGDFVSDGFRVVERRNGETTLCPFDGLPFDEAMSALRAANLADDDILQIVRS